MDQPQGIPVDQFYSDDMQAPPQQPAQTPPGGIPVDQFYADESQPQGPDLSKYETPGQQFATVAENAAQGIAGPLATLAETKLLGISPEDIKGRAAANPGEAIAGQLGGFGLGMFMGASEARAGTAIAEAFTPEAASILGKVGAKALNGAIQAGFFQANNEITKSLLGDGDPNHPVSAALSNVGFAALTGGAFGGAIGVAGAGIEKAGAAISKAANFGPANNFLYGIGLGSQFPENEVYQLLSDPKLDKGIARGIKAWQLLKNKGAETIAGIGLGYLGEQMIPEEYQNKLTKYGLEALGAIVTPKIAHYMGPLMYKLLSNGNIESIGAPIEYFGKAFNGEGQMSRALSNVFSFGSAKAVDHRDPSRDIEKIRDYIDNGGVDNQLQNTPIETDAQPFAKGGEVKNNPPMHMQNGLSVHLPEQNMLLNAAKMRVSNFLSSQSPKKNMARLPFDSDTKNPDQEREYEHTLLLAARPLEILNHVKKGNLTPKIMTKFTSMYPEIYGELSKRMTKTITEMQMKNEKPPYQLRQALSLFLGGNLDSTMLPQNITAAQATFLAKKAQQGVQMNRKMTDKPGQNLMTPEQARTKALNKT